VERWFLTTAAAVTAAAAIVGCGDQAAQSSPPRAQAPEIAPMSCQAGWTYNEDKRYFRGDWREQAVVAGPITLLWLNSMQEVDFSRPRAVMTKVLLEPHATTTVAVADADRDWVRLTTQPPNDPYANAGGDPGIRFEGCEPRVDDTREDERHGTGYAVAVMVDRPGCATFEITPEGGAAMRRRVAFGVQDCA
jgi:hypothetical protein